MSRHTKNSQEIHPKNHQYQESTGGIFYISVRTCAPAFSAFYLEVLIISSICRLFAGNIDNRETCWLILIPYTMFEPGLLHSSPSRCSTSRLILPWVIFAWLANTASPICSKSSQVKFFQWCVNKQTIWRFSLLKSPNLHLSPFILFP